MGFVGMITYAMLAAAERRLLQLSVRKMPELQPCAFSPRGAVTAKVNGDAAAAAVLTNLLNRRRNPKHRCGWIFESCGSTGGDGGRDDLRREFHGAVTQLNLLLIDRTEIAATKNTAVGTQGAWPAAGVRAAAAVAAGTAPGGARRPQPNTYNPAAADP